MADAETIINNLKAGHDALSKSLDKVDEYKKYLPDITATITLLTEYIGELTKYNAQIQKDIDEIKKDPSFMKRWKDILGALGVNVETLGDELVNGLVAWAKNYAYGKATEIADKYITKLSVDIVMALINTGLLPALIYNNLINSIKDEINYAISMLNESVDELDKVINGIKTVSFAYDKEKILKMLNYVRMNLNKDLSTNAELRNYLAKGDVASLKEDWVNKKDKYLEIAMEAMYPGNMMADPNYAGEFSNYRYIYRDEISLDSFKRLYESSELSQSLKNYIQSWSSLMKSTHNLSKYISEYNTAVSTLKLQVKNLINYDKLLKSIDKKWTPGIASKLINTALNTLDERIKFDDNLIRDIDNVKDKQVSTIETFRYTQSHRMLAELESGKLSNIISNTSLLTELLTILKNSQNTLRTYKYSSLKNMLDIYISIAEGMTFTDVSVRKLTKASKDLKNSAIFNIKELNKLRRDMSKYTELTLTTQSFGIDNMDTFLNSIGASESVAAMYMGDIKRCVDLLDMTGGAITNLAGEFSKSSMKTIKLPGGMVSSINEDMKAIKNKAYKTMSIDTLKSGKIVELNKMKDKTTDSIEKVKKVISSLRHVGNGS